MQLVVLGMHRSGTSIVTRLLNLMGAYFGEEGESTGANTENPKGFWERRDIRALNDEILATQNCDWDRVAEFDPASLTPTQINRLQNRFRNILMQLEPHRPWVIKEPRLCVTLPVIRECLEIPFFVVVSRSPVEVALSLQARNGFPSYFSIALWEYYSVSILNAMRGEKGVHFVGHGALLEDPVKASEGLVEALVGGGVTGIQMPAPAAITAFVSDSLYRARELPDSGRSWLTENQRELADMLARGICTDAELEVSDAALSVLADREEMLRTRAAEVEKTYQAEAQVDELRAALEACESDKARICTERDAARGRVETLATKAREFVQLHRKSSQDAGARVAELTSKLNAASARLAELEHAGDSNKEERQDDADEAPSLNRDRLRGMAEGLEAALKESRAERDVLVGTLASTEAELNRTVHRISQLEADRFEHRHQLQLSRAEVHAAKEEIAALKRKIAALDGQIEQQKAALGSQVDRQRKALRKIDHAARAISGSFRWKSGNLAARVLEILLFRKAPPSPLERISNLTHPED